MIQAERAQRILKLYEDDYDNFLDKLKAKRKKKKDEAAKKKVEADKADKTVQEAEAHKKVHLGQKAKDLIDKNGGIEGMKDTVQNVMKFFKKDEAPADYEVGFGKDTNEEKKTEKKILGMPPILVYAGGGILLLAGLFGFSKILKKTPANTSAPIQNITQPIQ